MAKDSVSDHNKITLFRTICTHKTFMIGLSMDKENKLGTFCFNASSPHNDSLLAQ